MSIDQAADAILHWPFERDAAVVMVAIGGPESGYNARAQGDHLSHFTPEQQRAWRPYACRGYCSHGIWQIHMPSHYPKLRTATGSDDPCVWAEYLYRPVNCAGIAFQVFLSSGFGAWTAYNTGAYRAYMDAARAAVDRAVAGIPVAGPAPVDLAGVEPVAPPAEAVEPPAEPVPLAP